MTRSFSWCAKLTAGLLAAGVMLVSPISVLAAAKISDGPHQFNSTQEPGLTYLYSDWRIGNGHVVVLESAYKQERYALPEWRPLPVSEYNAQELAEFNELARKYPFLENLDRSFESQKVLAEKLVNIPADDAEKITNLTKIILEDAEPLSEGQMVQKGFRIWSVDKPDESVFVPVTDPNANIVVSLGPTELVWKEFNGGEKYPIDSKTVMYSYEFATKKKNSYPLDKHQVAFEAEYHSAVVVVESDYFYWDLATNKMTKFQSLFKIPANYHQGGESQGSHYLGITLEPKGKYTPTRMMWLDTKTKKTFIAVYPKGMPAFTEWHVYGEFAYSYIFDSKTGQYSIWQFSFKNKQFTRLFTGKSNASSLSLREIDGRNLWFTGPRPSKTEEESFFSPYVIIRFNADKKTASEIEAPRYATYQDDEWKQTVDSAVASDPTMVHYLTLGFTRGNLITAFAPKSVTGYKLGDTDVANPRSIREIMAQLQAYRYSTNDLILTKSAFSL